MFSLRSELPNWIKRLVWNAKYADYVMNAPEDMGHRLLADNPQRILDLGCGAGNMLTFLRAHDWKGHYCGVDVSDKAIAQAQSQFPDANWVASSIEGYEPEAMYDAICFVESIYYVRLAAVTVVLDRCFMHLSSNGKVYVRIWDSEHHAPWVAHVQKLPRVVLLA